MSASTGKMLCTNGIIKSGIRGWLFQRAWTRICAAIRPGGRSSTIPSQGDPGASIDIQMETFSPRAVAFLSVVLEQMRLRIGHSGSRSLWSQRSRVSLRLTRTHCTLYIKVLSQQANDCWGDFVRSCLLCIRSDKLCGQVPSVASTALTPASVATRLSVARAPCTCITLLDYWIPPAVGVGQTCEFVHCQMQPAMDHMGGRRTNFLTFVWPTGGSCVGR